MSNGNKLRLDLPVLLPTVDDVRDACVARLIQVLKARDGIEEVHLKQSSGIEPQLCIHYDPRLISLSRVRDLARTSGARLAETVGHLVVRGSTMHARAARTLATRIRSITGVLEAEVTPGGIVRVEFDRTVLTDDALNLGLSNLGVPTPGVPFQAQEAAEHHGNKPLLADVHQHAHDDAHEQLQEDKHEHAEHDHPHGGPFGERLELVFALIAGASALAAWWLARQSLIEHGVETALYVVAYAFGGYFTLREALDNIRAKRFEIDTLMLVAAAGAAALGRWAEGALLLFLFSLGHALEHYAMGRARRAIAALAELAPERAMVRRNGTTEEVDVGTLSPRDIVIVRPNERLPADGFVVAGQSSVNQAPVTGESVPVDKRPVPEYQAALEGFERLPAYHRVFAGTINGSGALEVMVARRASESTMARVVRLVTEAEAQRSPAQNFTEKFERIFVPVVLVGVGLLLLAWMVVDEPFAASFYRAMAVLVAASPCALAISVPSAVLSGVARAGRGGVLVKGGAPLENLGTLTAIARQDGDAYRRTAAAHGCSPCAWRRRSRTARRGARR